MTPEELDELIKEERDDVVYLTEIPRPGEFRDWSPRPTPRVGTGVPVPGTPGPGDSWDDATLKLEDVTVVQGVYFPWAGVGFAVIEKEKQWTK